MTISMYQASVPVFVHQLKALSACLDKTEALCKAKKIDETVMTGMRLAPDMLPMSRQVQIACDFAKGASARLAGVDIPAYEDTEKTFGELRARIAKTIAYVQTLTAKQIDGSEEREMQSLKIGGNPVKIKGQPYLVHFAMPNFYFHVTTAYAILRHNGADIGKRDFMGPVPGLS
jgi:uncharacterized protein